MIIFLLISITIVRFNIIKSDEIECGNNHIFLSGVITCITTITDTIEKRIISNLFPVKSVDTSIFVGLFSFYYEL